MAVKLAKNEGINDEKSGTINGELKMTKIEQAVLSIIKHGSATTIVAFVVVTSKSQRTIKSVLKKLENLGLISRKGSKKTGHWKVNESSL